MIYSEAENRKRKWKKHLTCVGVLEKQIHRGWNATDVLGCSQKLYL